MKKSFWFHSSPKQLFKIIRKYYSTYSSSSNLVRKPYTQISEMSVVQKEENTKKLLTAFLMKETNPYPFDFKVCGSLTTLQSLKQNIDSSVI